MRREHRVQLGRVHDARAHVHHLALGPGDLELVPKGKTEPYTGVVRSEYNQEELYQLDRRVELVVKP